MTDASPAAAPDRRRSRRPLSLQSRLMVTVIGIVALILVLVAVATGAILGRILDTNLDARLLSAASSLPLRIGGDVTAAHVLDEGRQQQGFLFAMQNGAGLSGAYVAADDEVVDLTAAQLDGLIDQIDRQGTYTIALDGLGSYRVIVRASPSGEAVVAGLPTSEVTSTLGQIFTTVALVTTGGLLLLAVAIAMVIRRSLRPLRAVADTATRVASVPMAQGEVTIAERVPEEQTDEQTEIGRVGHALNTLLDHVDRSLTARQHNEELMRRFVADASHELRTPLASIRGYSELSLRALRQG